MVLTCAALLEPPEHADKGKEELKVAIEHRAPDVMWREEDYMPWMSRGEEGVVLPQGQEAGTVAVDEGIPVPTKGERHVDVTQHALVTGGYELHRQVNQGQSHYGRCNYVRQPLIPEELAPCYGLPFTCLFSYRQLTLSDLWTCVNVLLLPVVLLCYRGIARLLGFFGVCHGFGESILQSLAHRQQRTCSCSHWSKCATQGQANLIISFSSPPAYFFGAPHQISIILLFMLIIT